MFLARTGDRVQEKVGQRVARRCLWRLLKNASLLTGSALARCSTSVAKAASRSLSLLAFRIRTCCPCSCASAAYEEVLQDVPRGNGSDLGSGLLCRSCRPSAKPLAPTCANGAASAT